MTNDVLAVLPSEVQLRYQDARLLRRGARGLLLRARQRATGREVVVKLLEPGSGGPDPLAEARLHARAADLPGVLDLIEADVSSTGWVYLVTPYIAAGSLADRIEEGPLEIDEWLEVAATLLATLSNLHDIGVAHGDLKPSNALVGSVGDVVLTDFGCAELISPDATFSDSNGVFTTLAFAPPERLDGQPSSAPGDVYSVALLLGALGLGHSPQVVPGEPPIAFLERLTSGETPDFSGVPGGEAVRKLLTDMCSPSPANRPTAAESMERLRSATSTASPPAGSLLSVRNRHSRHRRAPTPPRRWRGIAATLVIALATGAFGYSLASTNVDRQALVFCRSYGELVSTSNELVMSAAERFRTAPSFANALETMMNDLPRDYAAAYQRFERGSDGYPESIRDDVTAAAPAVARLEMADYLARLDGSFVYDEHRRARMDRLPENLRGPAGAYVGVDQLAAKTCGLDESRFPEVKQRLVDEITQVLAVDGAAFFSDPSNAAAIPLDAVELLPAMAPKFTDQVMKAFPLFLTSMFATRSEIASLVISRYPELAVAVVESALGRGWRPSAGDWFSDLRRAVDGSVLADRLDTALTASTTG